MSTVSINWSTPDLEHHITRCARVSNPKHQDDPSEKLLKYCIKHKHWSIFEMANICIEIKTTRDISRQLLRHKSFSFQEFSQRYANVDELDIPEFKQARIQHPTNRQCSISCPEKQEIFNELQLDTIDNCYANYHTAIKQGIAKEQARILLPEGLTSSVLHMNGTVRSWIHYLQLRMGNGTQTEHIELANLIYSECMKISPTIFSNI